MTNSIKITIMLVAADLTRFFVRLEKQLGEREVGVSGGMTDGSHSCQLLCFSPSAFDEYASESISLHFYAAKLISKNTFRS